MPWCGPETAYNPYSRRSQARHGDGERRGGKGGRDPERSNPATLMSDIAELFSGYRILLIGGYFLPGGET
jgi:hypothetical protein